MKLNRLPILVALGLALGMSGCTKPTSDQASQVSKADARPATGDDALVKAVRAKLAASPTLSKETIDVAVADGRVVLSGTVSSGAVRIEAENLVRGVPDVFGVDAEKLVAKD